MSDYEDYCESWRDSGRCYACGRELTFQNRLSSLYPICRYCDSGTEPEPTPPKPYVKPDFSGWWVIFRLSPPVGPLKSEAMARRIARTLNVRVMGPMNTAEFEASNWKEVAASMPDTGNGWRKAKRLVDVDREEKAHV